jgi:hypothetical protein
MKHDTQKMGEERMGSPEELALMAYENCELLL